MGVEIKVVFVKKKDNSTIATNQSINVFPTNYESLVGKQ